MPKGQGHRELILYLRQYLLDYTDETHTVSIRDMLDYLENKHAITIERKTLYEYITLLENWGLKINRHRIKGYNVVKRDFDLNEIQLLIDSVQSSKFITQRKANEITEKLKKLASTYDRYALSRQNYIQHRIHSMNDSVFNEVGKIHTAIHNNKKISFRHFTYSPTQEKRKVYYKNRGKEYIVSPYALVWSDNQYYLVCHNGKKLWNYRVDRIDTIKILDEKSDGKEEFDKLNKSERQLRLFSMFDGEIKTVRLRFINRLITVVIDRFGKDVRIEPYDEGHFSVSVSVAISPQFYGWLLGMENKVKILSPDSVIEGMRSHIDKVAGLYQPRQEDVEKT